MSVAMLHSVAPAGAYDVCDPAIDSRGFRNALGQFGTGVAVVTARSGADGTRGALVGMTINSFAAVSLDPPLVLWSVRTASKRAAAFLAAESFAVNVLAESQRDVALAFASDPPPVDPYEVVDWTEGGNGSPLIDQAVARFECRPHAVHTEGDHHIVIGAVERCSVLADSPLLFVQGEFVARQSLAPEDEVDGGDGPEEDGRDGAAEPMLFARVLTAASYGLSDRFDAYRRRLGLDTAKGRILERLSRRPMTVEELGRSAFLGTRAVEDALAEMTDSGLVATTGTTVELTPAGDALRTRFAEAAEAFDREAFAGIPDGDLRVARRVLEALAPPDA